MTIESLASRIYAVSHLTGEFVLRSGRVAGEYFDKYRFEADPALLDEVAAGRAADPRGARSGRTNGRPMVTWPRMVILVVARRHAAT